MLDIKQHLIWIVPLGAMIIGFTAGWQVNGWRINNEVTDLKAEYAKEALMLVEKYREKEKKVNEQLSIFEKNLITANIEIDNIISDNTKLADGLRNKFKTKCATPAIPSASDTGNSPATMVSEAADVIGMCAERYSGLAGYADRIELEKEFYKNTIENIK